MTFDLDAVVSEAIGEPFTFTFGGEEFELPATVDIAMAGLFSQGKLYEALRRLLGPEQWQRMETSDAVFDTSKLVALLDAYGAHLGISLGESGASTRS